MPCFPFDHRSDGSDYPIPEAALETTPLQLNGPPSTSGEEADPDQRQQGQADHDQRET
jgi:hypothetical protein